MKERVWVEVIIYFTMELSFKKLALKSCADSVKNFRYDLYHTFAKDHTDKESVWTWLLKVVKNYPSISQDDWERFIIYRCSLEYKKLSQQGCELRKRSKYRPIESQDGYRKRDQKLVCE